MKTLFPFFILLFFSSLSQAQEFSPIGAIWHIELAEPFDQDWSGVLTNISIGDTIIHNQSCRVLNKSQATITNQIIGDYILCQKGDSILHYIPTLDTFNVVMDFGAEIGESWETFDRANEYVSFGSEWNQKYEVDSISYIFSNLNDSIKIQHLTTYSKGWDEAQTEYKWNGTAELIEHVGFRRALLPVNDGDGFTDDILEIKVRCYEDPIIGQINLVNGESCLTTSNHEIIENQIAIYPNPTAGEVRIDNDLKISQVEIYNTQGIKIVNLKNINSLDISDLDPGLYILKFQIENSVIFKSIIKID